jgi:hypothetical protein
MYFGRAIMKAQGKEQSRAAAIVRPACRLTGGSQAECASRIPRLSGQKAASQWSLHNASDLGVATGGKKAETVYLCRVVKKNGEMMSDEEVEERKKTERVRSHTIIANDETRERASAVQVTLW